MAERNSRDLPEDDLPIVDLVFRERYRLSSGPYWRYQIVLNQDTVLAAGVEFAIPEMQPRADVIIRMDGDRYVIDHFCNFFAGGIQMSNLDGSANTAGPFSMYT